MHRLIAPTLAGLLVLVSVGCVQPAADPPEPAAAPDTAAAGRNLTESVRSVGTVRFRMVVTVDDHLGLVELVTVGAYDLAIQRASSTATIEGDVWAVLAAEGEPVPPGLDQPVEEVLDGGVLYIRAPLADPLVGAPLWLSRTAPEGGPVGPLGLPVPWSGPLALLEALDRGDDLVPSGLDEVRGVGTQRFAASLDLWSEAVEQLPGIETAAVGGTQLDDVPASVWIDGEGRLRRLVLDLDGATLTLELYDYGEPVEITVPPAEAVRPVEDVLGAAPP